MKTLADALRRITQHNDLAMTRCMTHVIFDRLWKDGGMSRTQAYKWLAHEMNLTKQEAHIGNFTVAQCLTVQMLAEAKITANKFYAETLD